MAASEGAVEVQRALARVALRMRLRAGLRAGIQSVVAIVLASALATLTVRLNWLSARAALTTVLVAGALALVHLRLRIRAVPQLAAAKLADARLGLADRLTSASAFLDEAQPTPLMEAAILDAATAATSLDVRRVLSLHLPPSAWAVPVALLLLGVALFLRPQPLPPPRSARSAPNRPRLVIDADALGAEVEAVRRLGRESEGKDPNLSALATKLEVLLAAIDRQELSRAEAFARLAALEAALGPRPEPGQRPSEQLAPLTKALASARATEKLAAAIKADDLEAAQAELDRLAAQAEARAKQGAGSDEAAQRELQRALERAGRALDDAQAKAAKALDQKIEEHKEEQRRLEREKRERPDDEELERRLQRNKRELERLERERQAHEAQRRQLERLSRELKDAAEQLRQKLSPEAMRRAAEELGKMEEEIRKLGSSARAQLQIGELKEVLRRSGRVERGGEGGGPGQDGQQGAGKAQGKAQGKAGGGSDASHRLAEFDQRAGGQPNTLLLGGDQPGESALLLPLPAGPGQLSQGGGEQPGAAPGPSDPMQPGDGIGTGHDPRLLGERSDLQTKQQQIRAQGHVGAGPSRSQTILGASERGFSSREYRKEYKDYTAVVEEVMSQEGIPPGYRYYVKRYFQLIRPRE